MNPAIAGDEPTPEFRARLEWQIETALRRESRFSEPAVRPRPRFVTALTVAAALAIGTAAGMVPGYAQENREREQLLESARSEETLINLRLQLVRADVEQARRRVEAGVAARETLAAAEDQLRALEASLQRNHLDMEEIAATAAPPRNDLQAPLVGQRDFVRERLMLDLSTAQRALSAAEQEQGRAQQRRDLGIATTTELKQAQTDVLRLRAGLQQLAEELDLRQRALRGDLKGDDLAAAIRRLELTLRLQQLQQELDLAQTRLAEARSRLDAGMASQLDVKQGEVEVLLQQVEIRRLQQLLQTLPVRR